MDNLGTQGTGTQVLHHTGLPCWNREDETLDSDVDQQQHPTYNVFFNNIVALGMPRLRPSTKEPPHAHFIANGGPRMPAWRNFSQLSTP